MKTRLPRGVGYVYIIESSGQIKIGCSQYPDRRIQTIQSQSGRPAARHYISHVHVGHQQIEQQMHLDFAHARMLGEWFNAGFDDAVLRLIQLVPIPVDDQTIDSLMAEQVARAKECGDGLIRAFGGDPDWPGRQKEVPSPIEIGALNFDCLFDGTGIALTCLARIHAEAHKIYDAREESDGFDSALKDLTRQSAAGMAHLASCAHENLAESLQTNREAAPNESALVAISSLSQFANDLASALDDDPDDPTDAVRDVLFEMIRHDHARSWFRYVMGRVATPSTVVR